MIFKLEIGRKWLDLLWKYLGVLWKTKKMKGMNQQTNREPQRLQDYNYSILEQETSNYAIIGQLETCEFFKSKNQVYRTLLGGGEKEGIKSDK